MRRRLVAGWLLCSACAAWALGPRAPFSPPRAAGTQDPSAPSSDLALPAQTTGLTGLRLRHHPMALIDGRWLRVGAEARGARVHAIDARGAVLRHPDGRHELLLWNRLPNERAEAGERQAQITSRTSP